VESAPLLSTLTINLSFNLSIKVHSFSFSGLSQNLETISTIASLASSLVMLPTSVFTAAEYFNTNFRTLAALQVVVLFLPRTHTSFAAHCVAQVGRSRRGLQDRQQEPSMDTGFSPSAQTGTLRHCATTSFKVHLRSGRLQEKQQPAVLIGFSPVAQVSALA
jgi:hypothetical protein